MLTVGFDLLLSSRRCPSGVLTLASEVGGTGPSSRSLTAPCQTPFPPSRSRKQQVRPGFARDSKTLDLHVPLHCAHLKEYIFLPRQWYSERCYHLRVLEKKKKKETHKFAVYLTVPSVKTSAIRLKCITRQLLPPALPKEIFNSSPVKPHRQARGVL